MDELIKEIEQWSKVRKLDIADPKTQALKVIKEFTEMVLAFNDYVTLKEYLEETSSHDVLATLKNKTIDGIGDTYVALIILCQQFDIKIEQLGTNIKFISPVKIVKVLNQLSTGVSRDNTKMNKVAIMNMLGVTKHIAHRIDVDSFDCLRETYKAIKDRKGMKSEGTFIKYDDLSDENKEMLNNA